MYHVRQLHSCNRYIRLMRGDICVQMYECFLVVCIFAVKSLVLV